MQWWIPVIPATGEMKIRRMGVVQDQSRGKR
jgi:hypothetical protein